MTLRVGEDLALPKTVPAIFTDGSRSETEVSWDEAEVAAVDTQAVGQHVIHGTGGGKPALCYVNVVEANYLENYSFEDEKTTASRTRIGPCGRSRPSKPSPRRTSR